MSARANFLGPDARDFNKIGGGEIEFSSFVVIQEDPYLVFFSRRPRRLLKNKLIRRPGPADADFERSALHAGAKQEFGAQSAAQ